jgi:hypothetical protein
VDFKTGNGGRENAGTVASAGIWGDGGDQTGALATGPAVSEGLPADSASGGGSTSSSPRAGALATLAGELARLSTAGDLEGARVLNETIGRLLGSAAPGAAVVDLGAERARRGL